MAKNQKQKENTKQEGTILTWKLQEICDFARIKIFMHIGLEGLWRGSATTYFGRLAWILDILKIKQIQRQPRYGKK